MSFQVFFGLYSPSDALTGGLCSEALGQHFGGHLGGEIGEQVGSAVGSWAGGEVGQVAGAEASKAEVCVDLMRLRKADGT